MKKIILTVAAVFALSFANAQDLKSKKGENYLPQSGDWSGWKEMTKELGAKLQLVGDDIFVTNPKIFKKGIAEKIGNAILIKVNQIGSLSCQLPTFLVPFSSKAIAIHYLLARVLTSANCP